MTEWTSQGGTLESRDETAELGGTMRLGAQDCLLEKQSIVAALYEDHLISERHRHRYEVNDTYVSALEAQGLKISGRSADGLVEIIEREDHDWFVACQFHPEFKSTPRDGHPLFTGYIRAALAYQSTRNASPKMVNV